MHSLRFHLAPSRSVKLQLDNVFDDHGDGARTRPEGSVVGSSDGVVNTQPHRDVACAPVHTEPPPIRPHGCSDASRPVSLLSHSSPHHSAAPAPPSTRASVSHRRGTAGLIDLVTNVWEVLGLCDLHETADVHVTRRAMVQFYSQVMHRLYDPLPAYPEESMHDAADSQETASTASAADEDDNSLTLVDDDADAAAADDDETTPCASLTPNVIHRALWHLLCHATLYCAQLSEMTHTPPPRHSLPTPDNARHTVHAQDAKDCCAGRERDEAEERMGWWCGCEGAGPHASHTCGGRRRRHRLVSRTHTRKSCPLLVTKMLMTMGLVIPTVSTT